MPWFKVDDGFAFHPKAIEAGNAALGLWVRAGAWCGANLTDGALPRHMIGTLGAQARDARRLVAVGLWVETEKGYQFHEWENMQPTKADVEADRAENRKRQKAFRERQRNGVTNGVTDAVTNPATNDTPSRPVPSNKEKTPSPASPSRLFDQFWDWYPRKVGKPDAVKAYEKAVKKHGEQVIIAGVERLRLDPNLPEKNFIPHPATWLNREGWNDEPFPARNGQQQVVVTGPWTPEFHQKNGSRG